MPPKARAYGTKNISYLGMSNEKHQYLPAVAVVAQRALAARKTSMQLSAAWRVRRLGEEQAFARPDCAGSVVHTMLRAIDLQFKYGFRNF